MKQYLLHVIIFAIFPASLMAQTAPFVVANGVFDQTNSVNLGLTRPQGLENVTVFAPSNTTDHFSNGVVMAAFKGKLYCMWQSSQTDEDASDTWVAYAVSGDDGATWSQPKVLCPTISNGYCSSGGWQTTNTKLIGYINVWPSSYNPKGGYTQYVSSEDGVNWTSPTNVTMSDKSRMDAIFEQDPHIMKDGRIVNAAHFYKGPVSGQTGLFIQPIYTDDSLGISGWKRGTFTPTTNGSQSVEMEPSEFVKSDGTIVMIFRDQKSSFYKLAASSTDNGLTWTNAVKTNMPDARTKQCAGNLPDGTAYMVGNPFNGGTDATRKKWRTPLAITLSKDGNTFTKAYLLRDENELKTPGASSAPRYSGKSKSSGFSYPKAMIYKNHLYVSYARNKEDVEYTRIPLASISLNTDIENVNYNSATNGIIYTITGCKIGTASETNVSNLPHGIYILNGKKFIVK